MSAISTTSSSLYPVEHVSYSFLENQREDTHTHTLTQKNSLTKPKMQTNAVHQCQANVHIWGFNFRSIGFLLQFILNNKYSDNTFTYTPIPIPCSHVIYIAVLPSSQIRFYAFFVACNINRLFAEHGFLAIVKLK